MRIRNGKEKQRDPKNERLRRLRRLVPTQCSENDRESEPFSRDPGGTQDEHRIIRGSLFGLFF